MSWTLEKLPAQAGKTFFITGGNSGIGFEAAKMLAQKGADVVLGCRDAGRAKGALEQLRQLAPNAKVSVQSLDLASLESVKACAAQLSTSLPKLDGLINNAGVMALPLTRTADGFEMQIGTNHLGHFALTLQLLPLLEHAPAPRVVSVSSLAHKLGSMKFDDLNSERGYSRWGAYGQSKLANLLFIRELERRLRAAKKKTAALACHPGYSATNLQLVAAKMDKSSLAENFYRLGNNLIAQSAEQGAMPTVYAACEPSAPGGAFIGPDGLFELRGLPRVVDSNAASKDDAAAARLWDLSAQLTHVATL